MSTSCVAPRRPPRSRSPRPSSRWAPTGGVVVALVCSDGSAHGRHASPDQQRASQKRHAEATRLQQSMSAETDGSRRCWTLWGHDITKTRALPVVAYPRVCGAGLTSAPLIAVGKRSSPRVRSRQSGCSPYRVVNRLIPACAEQTTTGSAPKRPTTAHPRVRGADPRLATLLRATIGSSPRVRSRPSSLSCPSHISGSSPRVRSRRTNPTTGFGLCRLIPACAEQTHHLQLVLRAPVAHPRVCGADPRWGRSFLICAG